MSWKLLPSSAFIRAAKRKAKKNPRLAQDIQNRLQLLSQDPYHSSLKTHKLKGQFKGSWACSVEYDLRIVFEFVEHDGLPAILLQTVGTHDEVY